MLTRVLTTALGWTIASTAFATPTIVVGQHRLLPNRPDQAITLHVQGGDAVAGLNFRIQVEDGGPLPPNTEPRSGPAITGVDLIGGTIFAANQTGQQDLLRLPQLWVQAVTTESGTVNAEGLLARVTFDTTGFQRGSFRLALRDTLDGPTDFAGRPIEITDGTLRIVPEPAGWLLALAAALTGLGGWRVRRVRRVERVQS